MYAVVMAPFHSSRIYIRLRKDGTVAESTFYKAVRRACPSNECLCPIKTGVIDKLSMPVDAIRIRPADVSGLFSGRVRFTAL